MFNGIIFNKAKIKKISSRQNGTNLFLKSKIKVSKKDLGMSNDRIFAFSRGVELERAKTMEANPSERKLNHLLMRGIDV